MKARRSSIIFELEDRADYLTDENYHEEASILQDVADLLREEDKSDEVLLDEIFNILLRLGP